MDPRVRDLYKKLLYIGKDYPQGYSFFRDKLKKGFQSSKVANDRELQNALDKGDFIYKEVETLIFLTRYREMKRRYYD